MSKGKRFSAAEKHFSEKESKYQKQIKRDKETIIQMNAIQTELIWEKQKLLDENAKLREWIERLLQYTELSEGDIKAACEQDKKRGEAITSFVRMMGVLERRST